MSAPAAKRVVRAALAWQRAVLNNANSCWEKWAAADRLHDALDAYRTAERKVARRKSKK